MRVRSASALNSGVGDMTSAAGGEEEEEEE